MKIAEPNLLTLDYWRDEVSYQGITLPSGSVCLCWRRLRL